MAKMVLTDAYVLINSVNLSAWVKQVTLDLPADAVDVTTMGATQKVNLPGLKDFSCQITFLQDFAAGGPHATLAPLAAATGTGALFPIEIRPTSAARSVTNPAYTNAAVFIDDYAPVSGGSVGAEATATVSVKQAQNWARQTA